MRKQGLVRKFLTVLAVVLCLGAGTVFLSSAARATPYGGIIACGSFCIAPLSFSTAIGLVSTQVVAAINSVWPPISTVLIPAKFVQFSNMALEVIGPSPADVPECRSSSDNVVCNMTRMVKWMWQESDSDDDEMLDSALKKMTAQLTTISIDQSRQLAAFSDAANLIRVKRDQARQEIEQHRAQRPDDNTCTAGTVVGGMTRADALRRAYNSAAAAAQAPRSGNTVGTPGASGTAAAAKDDFAVYVTRYCRRDDNNGAAGCSQDGSFPGQDVDVTGTIFIRDTIDVKNPDTRKTVDDLIRRIAEPIVRDPVPSSAVDSTDGQAAILAGETYKARRQTIYDALYHVVARRTPGSKMGDFVRPIREAAGVPAAAISPNPSHNEVMQAMLSERFRDGKYALGQAGEPESNAREMVIQQAFQLRQMIDHLDLLDRYSLLLAGQAGAGVRAVKRPGEALTGASLRQ